MFAIRFKKIQWDTSQRSNVPPASAHSNSMNGGCERLVTEFRQRVALIIFFSAAPLLNEGINGDVSHQVQVVQQRLSFLILEGGSLKNCSTHLGSNTTRLRVRTRWPHSH